MRSVLLGCVLVAGSASADPGSVASPRGLKGFVTVDRLPVPQEATLEQGRLIWGESCQNCHGGNKLTGAPKITSTRAWAPRIEQGIEILSEHAISGFTGPKYTQMPARGGNPDLSDAEVKAAVAFMVWASGGAQIAHAYAIEEHQKDISDE